MNIDINESLVCRKKECFLTYIQVEEMKDSFDPIEIVLRDDSTGEIFGKQYVYYKTHSY
ncbi:MAG: hypothetical protein IPJ20_13470 [Flammeovirgaceae bacterium]|nr:hypothetical protein [Flammeovirgaceae bacterium]